MKEKNSKINCHSRVFLSGISTLYPSPVAAEGRGFTLVELLIAVIIIGVLVAVAVPQYQKAVLKSRFSSLMPTTRAIRDGQEAYYMRNGSYATAIEDLDIKAANTSDMEIAPGSNTDTDLKYVFATRPTLNNNLLVYQQHSPKFSGHIHCEALKDNSLAQWLCADALHGTKISGSVSGDEYETYVLEGEMGDNDYFAKACGGSGEQSCSCGGPISGTCNDKTGEWSFEESCPTPLPDQTEACGGGRTGNRTRHGNVCSGGTYTYGEWDESGCQKACSSPAPESVSVGCGGSISWNCVNGEWVSSVGEGSCGKTASYCDDYQGNGNCGNTEYDSQDAYCTSADTGYVCNNSVFSGKNSECYSADYNVCNNSIFSGEGSLCYTENNHSCNNSVFSGKNSSCMGEGPDTCRNSIFSGEGSFCAAGSSCQNSTFSGNGSECRGNDCTGSTFKTGSKCISNGSNGCATANYEGGCCEGLGCPPGTAC